MWKFCLFLLFAFASIQYSLGHQLELKRHETHKERLIRTGNLNELKRVHKSRERNKLLSHLWSGKTPSKYFYYEDAAFVLPIGFGSPPQFLNLVPDLGMGDLAVVDSNCVGRSECGDGCLKRCTGFACAECCQDPVPDHCSLKGNFSSKDSTSYSKNGREWLPSYSSGQIQGFLGEDTIRLPGLQPGSNIDVSQTTFAQISQLADNFINEDKASGFLGLGMETETADGTTPVFRRAVELGLVSKSIFTIWLNLHNKPNEPDGLISLGDYDTKHCSSILANASLKNFDQAWNFVTNNLTISAIGQVPSKLASIELAMDVIRVPGSYFYDLEKKLHLTFNFNYQKYEIDCQTKISMEIPLGNGASLFLDETILIETADDNRTCLFNIEENWEYFDTDVDLILGRVIFRKYCPTFNQPDHLINFSAIRK